MFSTDTSAPVQNRRRWQRYHLDIAVRLIVVKQNGAPAIIEGRGREVNEGGLSVYVGVELEIPQPCAVEFTSAYSGTPIRVQATLCNRNGYSYGLAFAADDPNLGRFREMLHAIAVLSDPASGSR